VSLLSINNLSCQKGYNLLFDELSIDVSAGDILRITGTNGSGKTSLLKILAGLNTQEQGTIHLGIHSVKSEGYQSAIFYLGHLPALSAELSCLENLQFLTTLNQSTNAQKLLNALNQIGLQGYEDEVCGRLSAGQKRRVILAGLFVSDAKVWLLDEPFTALDPQGVNIVEQRIEQHCQQGGMCLFTTHQDSALKHQKVLAL
jgi:heme exporter protein A